MAAVPTPPWKVQTMQTLDIKRPDMPDLQFVLLVTALCTSGLSSLNVPEPVRTTLFNRCWVLVHDGPPPGRLEERVIDLRPWTEVTLEAMVETIRSVLAEAGIRRLIWDHSHSEPTRASTPEAQPLIDRFEQLYPQPSKVSDAARGEAVVDPKDRRNDHGPDVWRLIGKVAVFMKSFSGTLELRAAEIEMSGKNSELADKVLKGSDVMQDSGNLYLAWARHYAALSEGNPEAADDVDET